MRQNVMCLVHFRNDVSLTPPFHTRIEKERFFQNMMLCEWNNTKIVMKTNVSM